MKKILFFTLLLGLSLALFTFGQEKQKDLPILEYKPQKLEIRVPSIPERKLGKEFKELDDFVRKNISKYPSSEFFMLLFNKKAVGQGRVESFDSEKLVLNSNGFKTTWTVTKDTTFLGRGIEAPYHYYPIPETTTTSTASPPIQEGSSELPITPIIIDISKLPTSTPPQVKVDERVKILGEWDGQNLLTKRIISLEPVKSKKAPLPIKSVPIKGEQKQVPLKEVQSNKLIEKLQEALQKAGVQIDLKQFLRNKQVCLQVITLAKNPQTGECLSFPTPCDVPQGWEKVNKCE